WSGAQTALHGILAALYERERSGVGQRVDTTLVQAFSAHDTWNAMIHRIARQYPEAFTQAGLADEGASVPNNSLFFRLLVALSAEIFRHGSELLDHPQMVHDRAVVSVDAGTLGAVRQPGPLAALASTPGEITHCAPALDEHGDALRAEAHVAPAAATVAAPGVGDAPPLTGVTVIELGTYYAAPYGATLLTDLGARVITVVQLDGDPIRHILPFPEVGAIKVLQGKQSVAVDIATAEGREIVLELVRRADGVLQSFRAGVAQ